MEESSNPSYKNIRGNYSSLLSELTQIGEFDRTVMGSFNFSFPEFENEHVWIPGTSSSCLHQLWEWIVKNHSADMLPFQDRLRRAILSSNVNYTLCNQDGGCHQVYLTNQPTDTCPLRHEKGTKIPEHKDIKVQKNCGVKMTELADLLKHFDFYNPTTRKCTYLSSKKNKQGEQSIHVSPKTKRKFAVIPHPFVLFLFNGKLKPGGKIEWNVVGNSSQLVDDFTSIYHIDLFKDRDMLFKFDKIVKDALISIKFKLPDNIVTLNCSYLDSRQVDYRGEVMEDQVKFAEKQRSPWKSFTSFDKYNYSSFLSYYILFSYLSYLVVSLFVNHSRLGPISCQV